MLLARYVARVDGSSAGSQEHTAVIPAAGALLQDTGTAREDKQVSAFEDRNGFCGMF